MIVQRIFTTLVVLQERAVFVEKNDTKHGDGVNNYKYHYFMLGNEYDRNAGGTLNGSIDEFSMWNKVLDYDTIQWLYNNGEGRTW